MTAQLTVRLPKKPAEKLETVSEQTGLRRSHIVRLALRKYLGPEGAQDATRLSREQIMHLTPRGYVELQRAHDGRRPIDRVRHLIGSVDSGLPGVAERHREYILETLERGR